MVEHEGRQLLDLGGMTVPTRRDADGALSIAIPFLSDLRVTPLVSGGTVGSLEVIENGSGDRLGLVEPPATAAAVAGRYGNTSASLAATITTGPAGEAVLNLAGGFGAMDYAMTPVGPDLWQAKGMSDLPLVVTLEFDPDGFRLSSGRTTRLRFTRAA